MASEDPDRKNQVGRWSEAEHHRFMMGITLYGKDWKKVEEIVGTRTGSQVRSHAQKFFNKLKKDGKKSTPVKKKQQNEQSYSDSQNSFMKGVQQDAESITPVELVSLIKKQSRGGQKINLRNLKKKLEDEMVIKEQDNEDGGHYENEGLTDLKRQNSFKGLNNILSAYENIKDSNGNDLEDESFLLKLTKRYKKYFQQGGSFEGLIDFGNPDSLVDAHRSMRKKSFTLPQGVEGDEEDLDKRKKRIATQSNTAQLNDKQLDAFRQAMIKHREINGHEGMEGIKDQKIVDEKKDPVQKQF